MRFKIVCASALLAVSFGDPRTRITPDDSSESDRLIRAFCESNGIDGYVRDSYQTLDLDLDGDHRMERLAVFFEAGEGNLDPEHFCLRESDLRNRLTCTGFLLFENTTHGWFPVMWHYDNYRLGLSLERSDCFSFDVLIGDPAGTDEVQWGWREDPELGASWSSAWRSWNPATQEYGARQFRDPWTIVRSK